MKNPLAFAQELCCYSIFSVFQDYIFPFSFVNQLCFPWKHSSCRKNFLAGCHVFLTKTELEKTVSIVRAGGFFVTWKLALTFCWLSTLTGISEVPGRLVIRCGHLVTKPERSQRGAALPWKSCCQWIAQMSRKWWGGILVCQASSPQPFGPNRGSQKRQACRHFLSLPALLVW